MADRVGLGAVALDFVGWATDFEDFDLDGRPDLFEANGSTINTVLGLPVSAVLRTKQGETQPIMKLPCDALAILYRFSMSGDLPMP